MGERKPRRRAFMSSCKASMLMKSQGVRTTLWPTCRHELRCCSTNFKPRLHLTLEAQTVRIQMHSQYRMSFMPNYGCRKTCDASSSYASKAASLLKPPTKVPSDVAP